MTTNAAYWYRSAPPGTVEASEEIVEHLGPGERVGPVARDAAAVEAASEAPLFSVRVLVVLAAHMFLGFAIGFVPGFGRLHAFLVAGIGTLVVLRGRLPTAVAMMAYIAGSEVMWRASRSSVPWEAAKYLVVLYSGIVLLRLRGRLRVSVAPILYFMLLLPSCLVLLVDARWGWYNLRRFLGPGMAGPLALAMMAWCCAQVTLRPAEMRRVFLAYVLPTTTMAAIALFKISMNASLKFTGESNHAMSGGFGPNQVATILGLGALLAAVTSLDVGVLVRDRLIAALLAAALATQSALTFSRGGLYAAAGALSVGLVFLLRTPAAWRRVLISAAVIGAVAAVVVPRVDAFTGGALAERFQEVTTTNRTELMRDDVALWFEHPLLGVGPSASNVNRVEFENASSHTEFTRLLAEHGSFGALALLCLLCMIVGRVFRARDPREQMIVATLLTWAMLSMAYAALKTATPVVIFGLAFAHFSNGARPRWTPPRGLRRA